MKYKLLFVLISAIYASNSLAGTALGAGASTSDGQQAGVAGNSTAIGANAWASDYSGLVGLNGTGSVAVGANSAAQGQGVAIGVGAQSFSQFIDNDGNYRGVAIGAGALSLGNGVALGSGTAGWPASVAVVGLAARRGWRARWVQARRGQGASRACGPPKVEHGVEHRLTPRQPAP